MAISYKRAIYPILSVVLEDGTIKLYFTVNKSALEAEKSLLNFSQVSQIALHKNFIILAF